MDESFYQKLDRKEQESRIDRLFRDRPENLHDYQGCANDPSMTPIPAAPALPDVAEGGKWPECQRYESTTGEIFNVRLVNKSGNKIVYTRSDVDLNGIFTVTLSEWLADLGAGEQRGETPADKVRAVTSKGEDKCDVCCGDGVATGGRPCICGGSGLSGDEKIGLRKEIFALEAELSRLSSPIFKSFSHMIGEILDRIDMAPNDDPIPYIRKYVDGLRKSHLTSASKEEQGGWIDCKQELPNVGQKVLVWHIKAEAEHIARYQPLMDPVFPWRDSFNGGDGPSVTHWQPLPTPPDSPKER